MISKNPWFLLSAIACGIVILKILISSTFLFSLVSRCWRWLEDRCHVYQFYKIHEFNDDFRENQLYRKVSIYLSSLSSIEDSDFANLFSGKKPNDFYLQLGSDQTVKDSFLGSTVSWKSESKSESNRSRTFILKIRKQVKLRILRPYLQHIELISDEIEQKRREIKLFTNAESENGRWISVPFTHPSTLETVSMDPDLKKKVRSDLESFLKSKQYFHRLGRVWKRSYLLYGPAGTGKTSFVAAMAKYLCYDIYDIDLSRIRDDSDLKSLMLQTREKSVVVVEDLDRFLAEESGKVSLSGILNFMDGIFSCCGEERVMVFTMRRRENIDLAIMRPGRLDVQIYFPLCDFSAFKNLASSYLGVKDHKLFPRVEEVFQSGASLSPAEIGEILIVNRGSPSRALKSVIGALQSDGVGVGRKDRGGDGSGHGRGDGSGHGRSDESEAGGAVVCRESVHRVREFRSLYGLLKKKRRGTGKEGAFFELED
ncbi:AAA-ATPase-like protein [Cinnamomum micranthum f. kanehirae]|uniref:AAA-ATPase-like protein n=1 Tax=Cinnamomum micranthum f. kanehirae TaxID=337451 RepID=A0A3S3N5W3_9MAGN|nr:AAA-ATPase-like protein [Cinnamomum micranthum f. kanehirae]